MINSDLRIVSYAESSEMFKHLWIENKVSLKVCNRWASLRWHRSNTSVISCNQSINQSINQSTDKTHHCPLDQKKSAKSNIVRFFFTIKMDTVALNFLKLQLLKERWARSTSMYLYSTHLHISWIIIVNI